MIKPLNKRNLYEEILRQVVTLIEEEEWKPGERILGEVALAKAFGVSRNSIREALKSLELSGVINATAGKGTYLSVNALNNIRRMELMWALRDSESLEELIQTRLIIEPQLAALAAQFATEEDIEEMRKIIEKTIDLVKENRYTIEEGMKFHLKLMESSKNKVLSKFMNSIADELCVHRLLRAKKYFDKNVLLEEMEEHSAMVDLIQKKDTKGIRELAEFHVKRVKDIYYSEEDPVKTID